jgi:hypothetical protein
MDMLHNQLHRLTLVLHYATKNALKGSMLRKAWSNRPILNQSPGRSTPGETLCLPTPDPFPHSASQMLHARLNWLNISVSQLEWFECLGLRQSALVRLAQWAPCKRKAKVVVKPFYSVLPLDTQRIPGTYNMSKVSKGIIWYWCCPKRDPKRDPISLNDTAVAMSNILKWLNVDLWQQLLETHWWITIINIMSFHL